MSPAASESENERCAGMVKTAGRAAAESGILERRFRHRDRTRRADVEPQPLVHGAKAAAFVNRPIPQDVGRERPLGRVAEQALRHHLYAGEDERCDVTLVAAAYAPAAI